MICHFKIFWCVFIKNILIYNHNTTIKIRKLTLILYWNSVTDFFQIWPVVANVSSKRIQFQILCCILLSCLLSSLQFGIVSQFSLTFMTLKLGDYKPVILETILQFGLSDISLWLDLRCISLADIGGTWFHFVQLLELFTLVSLLVW